MPLKMLMGRLEGGEMGVEAIWHGRNKVESNRIANTASIPEERHHGAHRTALAGDQRQTWQAPEIQADDGRILVLEYT